MSSTTEASIDLLYDSLAAEDVVDEPVTLQELISGRMDELGWNKRDVSRRTEQLGNYVSDYTVQAIARGLYGSKNEDKLKALAAALGLPEKKVLEAARNSEVDTVFRLPELQYLNEENRDAVRSFAKARLKEQRANERSQTTLKALLTLASEGSERDIGLLANLLSKVAKTDPNDQAATKRVQRLARQVLDAVAGVESSNGMIHNIDITDAVLQAAHESDEKATKRQRRRRA